MKNPDIKIFNSPEKLVKFLCDSFIQMISKTGQRNNLHVALSGGSTPRLFFEQLAQNGKDVSWQKVHFYWGDERCVPPTNPDSNFGLTKKYLLDKIDISDQNLHRIYGEKDPTAEAERYSLHLLESIAKQENNYPVFDWIILGLGEDGHTASIFPGQEKIIRSTKICAVAEHPQTSQKRITMTLPAINQADRITFLVNGTKKAEIVAKILLDKNSKNIYPAAMIQSHKKAVEWYLDKNAASLL